MSQICFFCKKAPADPASALLVRLTKTLGQNGGKLYLQKAKVQVPSCAPCGKTQTEIQWQKSLVVLLCWVIPAIVGLIALGPKGGLAGLGIGFIISLAASTGGQSSARDYPEVQALLKDGWYVD